MRRILKEIEEIFGNTIQQDSAGSRSAFSVKVILEMQTKTCVNTAGEVAD